MPRRSSPRRRLRSSACCSSAKASFAGRRPFSAARFVVAVKPVRSSEPGRMAARHRRGARGRLDSPRCQAAAAAGAGRPLAARCGAAVPGLHVQQGILAAAGRDGGRQSGGHRRPDQLVRQDHRRARYGYERDLRVHPARDRPRDRLAADPQARARRLDRVGAGRVVVRRGPRRGPERRRRPGQRRAGRRDHLRAARRPAVARPPRPGGPLHRRLVHRGERGPGALAGAVGQPGLSEPAPRDQGAEGARRHGLRDGVRAARLAVPRRRPAGGVPDQPWSGRAPWSSRSRWPWWR